MVEQPGASYEDEKKWYRDDFEDNVRERNTSQSTSSREHALTHHAATHPVNDSIVAQLVSMGFREEESRAAAIATQNRIEAAVDYLINGSILSATSRVSVPAQLDFNLELLKHIGFSQQHAQVALEACGHRLDSAVEHVAILASDEYSAELRKISDALTQLESDTTALELDASDAPKAQHLCMLEDNLNHASCVLGRLDSYRGALSQTERLTEIDRCNALTARIGFLRNSIVPSEAVGSSPSSAEHARVVKSVEKLVVECCPELQSSLPSWLQCYKDPNLLYASLMKEYGPLGTREVFDSDDGIEDNNDDDRMGEPGVETTILQSRSSQQPCADSSSGSNRKRLRDRYYKIRMCAAWSSTLEVAWPSPRNQPASFLKIRPKLIGFCHDSVSPGFRNGKTILQTLLELVNGTITLRDIPMMHVIFHNDQYFSVSNRRLCLYRLCDHLGLLPDNIVKVRLLSEKPRRFVQKFTTPCDGDWVRVRRDGRICGRTLEETTFGRELFT